MSRIPPRVIVFDSGVGGLSIFAEIKRQLPWCELIFASDAAGFPYGIRSEADLIARVDRVVGALLDRVRPDVAVIACNSASTVVLPVIRSKYALPFVGVVPAIKPAAALSRSHHIGLLATPATVGRSYTRQLIADFATHCQVDMLGSSELVYLAEAKLRGELVDVAEVRRILSPLFDPSRANLDTIVLACTHFPLIRDELEQAAAWPVNWVDSAEAVARRVHSLLADRAENSIEVTHHSALITGTQPVFPGLVETMRGLGIAKVELEDI